MIKFVLRKKLLQKEMIIKMGCKFKELGKQQFFNSSGRNESFTMTFYDVIDRILTECFLVISTTMTRSTDKVIFKN